MTISRGQMKRQLYMGGGIMDVVPREKAIFGGIKKAVKKVGNTVKKIASSDVGKAALIGAAAFGIPGTSMGGIFGRSSFMLPASGAGAPGIFGFGGIGNAIAAGKARFLPKSVANYIDADDVGLASQIAKKKKLSSIGNITKLAGLAGVSTFLTSTLGMTEEQAEEELARDPSKYLELYYRNLNPPTADTNAEEYETQVRNFVETNTAEYTAGQGGYAKGGRIGFDNGTADPSALGLMGLPGDPSEIEFYDYFKDISSKPNFVMPEGSGERDDLNEAFLFKDNDMAKAEKIIDEQGLDELYEKAVEIVKDNDEANEYFLSLVNNKDLNISAADAYYSVIKKFGTNKAEGGRIGYAEGTDDEFPLGDPTAPVNPFGPKPIGPVLPDKMMASDDTNERILEALFEKYLDMGLSPKDAADKAREEFDRMGMRKTEGRGLAALGGKMDTASDNAMQAAGIERLPIRQNPKGVKELDLRETGGFIQPVGIKEKEDDIPAMLSNNEFVMTADAVRGMGDGDVNLGAQRMYDQMKMLEAGGKV